MITRRVMPLFLLLIMSVIVVQAQEACNVLVQQALEAVDRNCVGLDGVMNSACYGYDTVSATFTEEVEETFFSAPSDLSEIILLEEVQTTEFDPENDQWGVAVMKLQANLPNTLPGQAVWFILLGDVKAENAVDPDEIFTPVDPIPAVVRVGANLRSGPSTRTNVVGTVSVGTEVMADGVSPDGGWIRIVHGDMAGWMSRTVINNNDTYDDLPVLDGTQRTAMQSFYLDTGLGVPDCSEAPDDVLVVQGPDDIYIDLTVNGAEIQIGSTIMIQAEGDKMIFIVLDGRLIIKPNQFSDEEIIVNEGERVEVCLGDPDDRGIEGDPDDRVIDCAFSDPIPVDLQMLQAYCTLQDIPLSILNYNIDIICPGDPETIRRQPANNPPPPNVNQPPVCSNFVINGPTSTAITGPVTFSWTAVPAATYYQVVFYDYLGNPTPETFNTPNTSLLINTGEVATGSEFQWEVRAYNDAGYICVTPRSPRLYRTADPNAPIVVPETEIPVLTITNVYCHFDGEVEWVAFSWSGADPAGITFIHSIYGDNLTPGAATGESGTVITSTDGITDLTISSPNRDPVSWSGTMFCFG